MSNIFITSSLCCSLYDVYSRGETKGGPAAENSISTLKICYDNVI